MSTLEHRQGVGPTHNWLAQFLGQLKKIAYKYKLQANIGLKDAEVPFKELSGDSVTFP